MMTFQEAKNHLKTIILPNGQLDGLLNDSGSLFWFGGDRVWLAGKFTADDLTAVAAYIKDFDGS